MNWHRIRHYLPWTNTRGKNCYKCQPWQVISVQSFFHFVWYVYVMAVKPLGRQQILQMSASVYWAKIIWLYSATLTINGILNIYDMWMWTDYVLLLTRCNYCHKVWTMFFITISIILIYFTIDLQHSYPLIVVEAYQNRGKASANTDMDQYCYWNISITISTTCQYVINHMMIYDKNMKEWIHIRSPFL